MVQVSADFLNLLLAGRVPVTVGVRPHFLGETLHAINKSCGGIRSIAVGLTLRRMVAKAACAKVLEKCGPILAP